MYIYPVFNQKIAVKNCFYNKVLYVGIEGLDKAESQKLLSRGNQLLNAGQLAEALAQYHSAIGKFVG